MRRNRSWGCVLVVLALAGCTQATNAAGTTGEHSATGMNLGAIDVDGDGAMDGTGYDTDGDGRADEVDTDADGIIDGEDNDGDGTITLWDDLGTGALEPSPGEQATQIVDTDPDFDRALDPTHPPDGSDATTGEVTPPASVLLGLVADREVAALSQGQQGSCAAFANAAAATLVRHEREGGDPASLWASPAFLYAFQVPASMATCGEGTYIHHGLDLLVREGAATLTELPYRSAAMPMLCEMDPPATTPEVFRIGSYESIRPFDSATIREVIAAGSPVVFATPVTAGFFSWSGATATGVFDFGTDDCSGMHCGGHAMAIIGYDDARQAFRVLNSWGGDWGDHGLMWLSYDYFDRGMPANQVYGYSLTPLPTAPAPLAAPDEASFAAELVGGVVLRSVTGADGTPQLVLTAGLSFTEPVHLARADVAEASGASYGEGFEQWITYGNVSIPITSAGGTPGSATLTLTGTLRNDAAVTTEVTLEIPEVAPDADGAN